MSDLDVITDNEQQDLGGEIIKKAVFAPFRQMATNAGESADILQEKIINLSSFEGYNFSTGTTANMLQAGIIDPVKVTRSALQNAVSVAGTLITTGHAIIQVD